MNKKNSSGSFILRPSTIIPILPPSSFILPPSSFMLGLLSFPGVDQVLSWSFTLSHGITPSAALVEIAPQFGLPAEMGTMIISFGDEAFEFTDCVLDSAAVRRDESGVVVSLTILDRTWRG